MNYRPDERIPVGVLGATGAVGQRFVQLLEGHPWFEVAALTGSDRTVGKRYVEAKNWMLSDPMPERLREKIIQPSEPEALNVPLVFSALHSGVAGDIEPEFAKAGCAVCSNASTFRTAPDVPLLMPEVNAGHIDLIPTQRQARGWSGYIVTTPNCTSAGLTVVIKALDDAFGVKSVFAVSMQALSGAGYPGVPSLDVADNVVPYVGGEEEKVEWEPRKMTGTLRGDRIQLANFGMTVHTNRVAVSDGHMVCASLELERKAAVDEVIDTLVRFNGVGGSRGLPSSPDPVIQYRPEPDRPQPRLDRMTGKGMTTVVGRVRPDPLFDFKMVVLSHNTIRGAAGGSIYNAELLYKQGFIG